MSVCLPPLMLGLLGSSTVVCYPVVCLTPLLNADVAGEKFAEEAVELEEDNWEAHKWFAVLTGSGTKFVGTNEKIQRGHKYKVRM